MNLIDRYVIAVAQQLPASRRDDIARELKANILDRLENFVEEHGRPTTSADESAILRELGHPRLVAAAYLPQRQLVSPEWFPFYTQCLIYGLASVVIVQSLIMAVVILSSGNFNIEAIVSGMINGALMMFAIVTGVFFAICNLPAIAKLSPYCNWQPEQLPPIKQPWQRIQTLDSVCEFAGNLFLLLALQYPLWMPASKLASIYITPGPGLQQWIVALSLATSIAIAINLWNLHHDYWTATKLKLSILLRLLAGVLCVAIAATPDKFVLQGQSSVNLDIINHIGLGIFAGAACISLFEAGRSAYRLYLLNQVKAA